MQGSKIEPLLFLIYITDLPEGLKSKAKLFADDTSIFSIKDINVATNQLSSDLSQINKWALSLILYFNSVKNINIHIKPQFNKLGLYTPNNIKYVNK